MRIQWSPTALAVPITLCDFSDTMIGRIGRNSYLCSCRDRGYVLSGPSYVAPVATGCGTSLVSRPRSLNLLRCAAFEEQWLPMLVEITHDRVFGIREN